MKLHKKDYLWLAGLAAGVLLLVNIFVQGIVQQSKIDRLQPAQDEKPAVARESPAGPETGQERDISFPNLELLGTMLGKPSVAFIWNPATAGSCLYKVGDTVEGAKVAAIFSGRVVIEKEGAQKELFLVSRRERRSAPVDSFVSKDDSGTLVINKYEMMAELVKDKAILSKVKILPLPDAATNKLRGFKVDNVPEGSIIEEVGIKNGDIICSVQGQKLQSMQEAFGMFNRIQNQSRIEVVLLRDETPVTLRYEIRN